MRIREVLYGSHNPYDGVTLLPFDKFGWNSDSPEFFAIIEQLKPKLIIEVGTYFGASARNMATFAKDYHKDVEIVCIDTFLGSVEHWHNHQYFKPDLFKNGRPPIFEQFISNVIHLKLTDTITPFPIDSVNGGLTLQRYGVQADLIYIDGGHEYESITTDLRIFRNLVRPGGMVMLDDSHYEPIQKAAQEQLAPYAPIKTQGTKILWTRPN